MAYKDNWGYVESMIDRANEMGFQPSLTRLMASKWAAEGGRKPRLGSLGLSTWDQKRLSYKSLDDELNAYKSTTEKILGSKGYKLADFKDKNAEELFDALQYRPEGKVAGKDYYMYNNVIEGSKYKKLVTGVPEYRHFTEDYIKSRVKPVKQDPVAQIYMNIQVPKKTEIKRPDKWISVNKL